VGRLSAAARGQANQPLQRTGRASRSPWFDKWLGARPAAERQSVIPASECGVKSDVIIIGGMLLAIAGGVLACVRSRLLFPKIGFIFSAVAVCVGLANFGWRPLFGGIHTPDVYFGCVTCGLGMLGFCLFGAIEEVWRRFLAAPDERPGFPVVSSASKEPE